MSLTLAMLLGGCGIDAGENEEAPLPTFTSPAGIFNDADVHFAQQMGPHSDQAVEMSKILLDKRPPVDADIRGIAQQIKVTREPDIEMTSGWLTAWGKSHEADTADTSGGHHGGGGVMSETQMQELDRANTATGQRLFLDGMIRHHQGAVAMAETEIQEGVNPQVLQYAKQLVESQTAQITAMQRLRDR